MTSTPLEKAKRVLRIARSRYDRASRMARSAQDRWLKEEVRMANGLIGGPNRFTTSRNIAARRLVVSQQNWTRALKRLAQLKIAGAK